MALDLRRLRYFRMIATQGSLSGAARVLNVAQPALTHHVAELEQFLGVILFERSSRGVELTEGGEALLAHADAILDRAAFAEHEMKKLADRARHTPSFSIAITPSLTAIAPALLQAVSTRLPKLNLRIAGMNDRSAESLLESSELDAVLRYSDWKKGGIPLVWGSLVLVTRPADVGKGDTLFSELAGEKLLLPFVGNPLRRLMDDTASQTGTKLNIVAEIEGTAPRKEAVLAGLGSTVAIWQSVARECAAGWLNARRIVEPGLRRLLVVDHRKGVDLQAFQIVQEEALNLLGGPYTTAA